MLLIFLIFKSVFPIKFQSVRVVNFRSAPTSCDTKNKEKVAIPLVYCSVRSSLISGLFWANRYDEFDGTKLPSFMNLSSEDHKDSLETYMALLIISMREQLEKIKQEHLLDDNFIAFLEETPFFQNAQAD